MQSKLVETPLFKKYFIDAYSFIKKAYPSKEDFKKRVEGFDDAVKQMAYMAAWEEMHATVTFNMYGNKKERQSFAEIMLESFKTAYHINCRGDIGI